MKLSSYSGGIRMLEAYGSAMSVLNTSERSGATLPRQIFACKTFRPPCNIQLIGGRIVNTLGEWELWG